MLLKSLKLENIRSYGRELIEFPEGSTLLSGDIGSGKSSILLSIEFALFGIRRKHLDGESLVRYGKNEGSVELKFEIDGKEIIVKRNLKKVKDEVQQISGYIILDGRKKEATAIELKTIILDLLGYPKDMVTKTKNLVYRYTVYTPQEEMKHILLEEDRLDTLRRVFDIDKYKRIRENSQLLLKELKQKRKLLEIKTEGIEEKKKTIDETTIELNAVKESHSLLIKDIHALKDKLNECKNNESRLEQDIKKLNQLKKEIELNEEKLKLKSKNILAIKEDLEENQKDAKNLRERINSIKIENIPSYDEELLEKEIASKEEKLRDSIEEESRLKEQLNTLNEKQESLSKEIGEKIEGIKNLEEIKNELNILLKEISNKAGIEDNLMDNEDKISDLIKKISSLETKIHSSEKIKLGISDLKDCPTCMQPVPETHKERISKNEDKKISELSSELKKYENERSSISGNIKSLKEELLKIISKESKAAVIDMEIKNLNNKMDEIQSKKNLLSIVKEKQKEAVLKLRSTGDINKNQLINEVKEKKLLLKKVQEGYYKKREKENIIKILEEKEKSEKRLKEQLIILEKDIEEIKSMNSGLSDSISSFSDSEKLYDEIKNEIRSCIEEEKKLEIRKAYAEKDIESLERSIKDTIKLLKEMSKMHEKLQYLKQTHNWIENYFIMLMSTIEKHVMLNIYSEFNEFFQQWFSMLIEDETMAARLSEEFAPIISQNGYESSITNLSGGERTAAALAYRLALNKSVNDIVGKIKTKDIIILDEPTEGFSSEQLDRVRTVLNELGIKQTIIVSHESKIESFVENVIKISKNEGISRVSS